MVKYINYCHMNVLNVVEVINLWYKLHVMSHCVINLHCIYATIAHRADSSCLHRPPSLLCEHPQGLRAAQVRKNLPAWSWMALGLQPCTSTAGIIHGVVSLSPPEPEKSGVPKIPLQLCPRVSCGGGAQLQEHPDSLVTSGPSPVAPSWCSSQLSL